MNIKKQLLKTLLQPLVKIRTDPWLKFRLTVMLFSTITFAIMFLESMAREGTGP